MKKNKCPKLRQFREPRSTLAQWILESIKYCVNNAGMSHETPNIFFFSLDVAVFLFFFLCISHEHIFDIEDNGLTIGFVVIYSRIAASPVDNDEIVCKCRTILFIYQDIGRWRKHISLYVYIKYFFFLYSRT